MPTRIVIRLSSLPVLLLLFAMALLAPAQAAQAVETREIALSSDRLDVKFTYPVLGMPAIDADVRQWARQTVDTFAAENATVEGSVLYEMKGSYSLVRASDRILTVVWSVWSFTGGAHGMLDIETFSYDARTGQPLDLQSLFADEDAVLTLFSRYARARLTEQLGDMAVADMIASGTSPDLENFAAFAPTPDGLRLYFQPYQVAPWAAGPQELEVPLAELEEAGPRLVYWGLPED